MSSKTIELNLSDEQLLYLAREAHKKDITLNKYINQELRRYMIEMEKENAKKTKQSTKNKNSVTKANRPSI
jgi:hypothetical protein